MEDAERLARNRIWWRSRRGLRELDLLLLPFVEDCYLSLDENERAAFLRLIDNEDPELLAWFTARGEPLDPELAALIRRIRAHRRPLD